MMRMLLMFLVMAWAGGALALSENFDLETGPELPEGWKPSGTNWGVRGGALWKRGAGERQMVVIEKAGEGGEVSLEATVTVRRREGGSWAIAGLCIAQDVSNLWHFAFVEAPPDKGATHYVELLEVLGGVRQAQNTNATKLACIVKEGGQFAWEVDKPYRFKLVIRDGKVEGTVHEMDGTRRARIAYELKKDLSVMRGKAAVIVTNFVTVFDDFKAEVAKP